MSLSSNSLIMITLQLMTSWVAAIYILIRTSSTSKLSALNLRFKIRTIRIPTNSLEIYSYLSKKSNESMTIVSSFVRMYVFLIFFV